MDSPFVIKQEKGRERDETLNFRCHYSPPSHYSLCPVELSLSQAAGTQAIQPVPPQKQASSVGPQEAQVKDLGRKGLPQA